MAARILALFYQGYKAFRAAGVATKRVKGALYDLLCRRRGPRLEFEELKPKPPDTSREADEAVH